MGAAISRLTQRPNLWPWLLLAPLGIYLAVFFLVPLLDVAVMSVTEPRLSVANYHRVLTGALYQTVLLNTFLTAALVTIACLCVGYPLAYLMNHSGPRAAMLILLLVTMSFWTSFLVRTYAWMVILGNNGPIIALLTALGVEHPPQLLFTRFSSTLAMVHILAPYMIMNIYSVMRKIDPVLIRSAESLGARGFSLFRHVYLPLTAQSLGASPVRTFIHVTLPLLRPGLIISALFAFVQSFDETVVAIFISGRDAETLPRKMFDSIRQEADPVIAVISTLLFVAVLLTLVLPTAWKDIRKRLRTRSPAMAATSVVH